MMFEKYEKAGKIAAKVRNQAAKKITAGMKVSELVDFVENSILETGAGLSFPCNISINEMAAHYTSNPGDDTLFCEGDIVKIDLGAEVDGYISDTAITVIVEGDNKEPFDDEGNLLKMPGRLDNGNPIVTEEELQERYNIIEASSLALQNAISIIREGTSLQEIGETVQNTIEEKGYTPVSDLAGHSLEQYNLHAGLTIPNVKSNAPYQLQEGDHIAVEPLATNGVGLISDVPECYIYSYIQYQKLKPDAKKLLRKIREETPYFPFSQRRFINEYEPHKLNTLFNQMSRSGAIYAYNALKEKENGMVAQTEHTLIVEKDGCHITTL